MALTPHTVALGAVSNLVFNVQYDRSWVKAYAHQFGMVLTDADADAMGEDIRQMLVELSQGALELHQASSQVPTC